MGFKNRKDFFDSLAWVMKCLETDERYCTLPEIESILEHVKKCQFEVETLNKMGKRAPKFASQENLAAYIEAKVNQGNVDNMDTETSPGGE
jgi:hypothetical protein